MYIDNIDKTKRQRVYDDLQKAVIKNFEKLALDLAELAYRDLRLDPEDSRVADIPKYGPILKSLKDIVKTNSWIITQETLDAVDTIMNPPEE